MLLQTEMEKFEDPSIINQDAIQNLISQIENIYAAIQELDILESS